MAKSRLIQVNKKVEEKVLGSYKKIEDKFVDQFLTHDGESIEDAKVRLNSEKARGTENEKK